jgi:hypothetical protein
MSVSYAQLWVSKGVVSNHVGTEIFTSVVMKILIYNAE